jgi:hypothetical protein
VLGLALEDTLLLAQQGAGPNPEPLVRACQALLPALLQGGSNGKE